jgi:DNA-binding XRE family transcriptional regulator
MEIKTVIVKILVKRWWFSMPSSDRPAAISVLDVDRIVLSNAQFLATEFRIGKAMKMLGFRKTRPMVDGCRAYFYVPSAELMSAGCSEELEEPRPTLRSPTQRRLAVAALYGRVAPSRVAVGVLLRAWRKEHGKTQGWLARAANITQTLIAKYENGTTMPMPSNALKIEEVTKGQVPVSHWYPGLVSANKAGS